MGGGGGERIYLQRDRECVCVGGGGMNMCVWGGGGGGGDPLLNDCCGLTSTKNQLRFISDGPGEGGEEREEVGGGGVEGGSGLGRSGNESPKVPTHESIQAKRPPPLRSVDVNAEG